MASSFPELYCTRPASTLTRSRLPTANSLLPPPASSWLLPSTARCRHPQIPLIIAARMPRSHAVLPELPIISNNFRKVRNHRQHRQHRQRARTRSASKERNPLPCLRLVGGVAYSAASDITFARSEIIVSIVSEVGHVDESARPLQRPSRLGDGCGSWHPGQWQTGPKKTFLLRDHARAQPADPARVGAASRPPTCGALPAAERLATDEEGGGTPGLGSSAHSSVSARTADRNPARDRLFDLRPSPNARRTVAVERKPVATSGRVQEEYNSTPLRERRSACSRKNPPSTDDQPFVAGRSCVIGVYFLLAIEKFGRHSHSMPPPLCTSKLRQSDTRSQKAGSFTYVSRSQIPQ
jgi:hypothetical protein